MSQLRIGCHVIENGKEGRVVAFRPQNMVDVIFAGRDYAIRRPASALHVIQSNPAPSKAPVFLAAVLTPEAKRLLHRWWLTRPLAPEPFPVTKATHMTIKFKPTLAEVANAPIGKVVALKVTGWAADGKIQAVTVECPEAPSTKEFPHVTYAIRDASVAPALSDKLLAASGAHEDDSGPVLPARVGWSDGVDYHFEMPPGVQSNPGRRGGLLPAERAVLGSEAFALPGRRWPINDKRHAIIAMQYILRGFGNAEDYPKVLAAIARRYPRADGANREIWAFYDKHFGQQVRMVANPKDDVYAPAKEQFRAVVQGVYESQVRRRLGLASKTPFEDAQGQRLDVAFSPEQKRQLLSSAYAIATRQGQKYGWLEPGTQTPTEKGRARAFERLSPDQVEHSTRNRQDYERTLATVRKGPHFRVVTQPVRAGDRMIMHYVVQPQPQGLVDIPAYRLTAQAAQQDAEQAQVAYNRALKQVQLRYNPGEEPEDETDEPRPAVRAFKKLTVAEAEAKIEALAFKVKQNEKELNHNALVRSFTTEVKAALTTDPLRSTMPEADFLGVLLGSRSDLKYRAYNDACPAPDIADLIKEIQKQRDRKEKFTKASPTEARLTLEKMGQEIYERTLERCANVVKLGVDRKQVLAEFAKHDERSMQALKNLIRLRPDLNLTVEDLCLPFDSSDIPYPESQKSLATKSVAQTLAEARSTGEREKRKASLNQQDDFTRPFYDVERVLLAPVSKVTRSGATYKAYEVHVLKPDETKEEACRRFRVDAQPKDLKVETRYVLYIPRTKRFIGKAAYAGGTQIVAPETYSKGIGKMRGPTLREEDLPEQEKRQPRRVGLYQTTRISEGEGTSVMKSDTLKKFFYVDGSKLGAEPESKLGSESSDEAKAKATGQDYVRFLLTTQKKDGEKKGKRPERNFLSPDENWVVYEAKKALFDRLRKGDYNADLDRSEGGISTAPQMDIFYTNSARLAYLTIKFFNDPAAMPPVALHTERSEAIFEALAGSDQVIFVPGERRMPTLTDAIHRAARRCEPLPRSKVMSVSPHFFEETPLNELFLGRLGDVIARRLSAKSSVPQLETPTPPVARPSVEAPWVELSQAALDDAIDALSNPRKLVRPPARLRRF